VGPVHISRDYSQSTASPRCAEHWDVERTLQGNFEALGRDGAWHAQWAADVLLVDHCVKQTNGALEGGHVPTWTRTAMDEVDKLGRCEAGVAVDEQRIKTIHAARASTTRFLTICKTVRSS
jgi:hypothetical protein